MERQEKLLECSNSTKETLDTTKALPSENSVPYEGEMREQRLENLLQISLLPVIHSYTCHLYICACVGSYTIFIVEQTHILSLKISLLIKLCVIYMIRNYYWTLIAPCFFRKESLEF